MNWHSVMSALSYRRILHHTRADKKGGGGGGCGVRRPAVTCCTMHHLYLAAELRFTLQFGLSPACVPRMGRTGCLQFLFVFWILPFCGGFFSEWGLPRELYSTPQWVVSLSNRSPQLWRSGVQLSLHPQDGNLLSTSRELREHSTPLTQRVFGEQEPKGQINLLGTCGRIINSHSSLNTCYEIFKRGVHKMTLVM